MDLADIQFWLVIAGFVIAFVLAFGIGANDVANSFGTSVGSKVLTLKQACILATIFEILGSILIGAKVSGTIRKGILDPNIFVGSELELMLGYVSALLGCCVWLILATILNYPVSGTHSIVGATIGMAIVSRGFKVIKWLEIAKIVLSWFISPLLSGVVSLVMFVLIRKFILRAKSPLNAGLKFLPIIYTITIFINIGGVLESSPPLLGFDKIPWWGKLIMIAALSLVVYLSIWLVMVPIMRKKVERQMAQINAQQYDDHFDNDNEKMQLYVQDESKNITNSEEKRTVSTQVDYVTLIMARNNQDFDEDVYNGAKKKQSPSQRLPQTQFSKGKELEDITHGNSITVHGGFENDKGARKYLRTRTITAPSSEYRESNPDSNITLTLRGYLHHIHTPAMRAQLSAKKSSNNSINNRERQPSFTSQNATVSGGDKNPSGGPTSLSKLFKPQNSLPSGAQTPILTKNDNLNEQGTNTEGEFKRGRFNLAPAKLSVDTASAGNIDNTAIIEAMLNQQQQQAVGDQVVMQVVRSSDLHRKSLPDMDEDVEENIIEMPTKKEKKVDVDKFAHSDPPEAARLFSFLQVLTAIFGSFAHGGNDVSNAIGPLIGLYLIYQEGKIIDKSNTPEWILFYGGVGISVGLWILGRRVIKTIGEDLTKITASSGFVIELASAMTVLGASLVNIPVSTTHCKVGSVVFTGRIRSKESVDWSLFRNIIIAWIVTVPVTGSIAGCCQFILKLIFMPKSIL